MRGSVPGTVLLGAIFTSSTSSVSTCRLSGGVSLASMTSHHRSSTALYVASLLVRSFRLPGAKVAHAYCLNEAYRRVEEHALPLLVMGFYDGLC
jgi:hypothetical protein